MALRLRRTPVARSVQAVATGLLLAACGTTVSGQGTTADTTGGLAPASTAPGAASTPGGPAGSQLTSGGANGTVTTNGGTAAAGQTTTAGGTTSSMSGSTVHVPATGGDRQGVTATTVKIGVIGINAQSQTETNAAFGVTTPPANTQDAMNAIVNWANAHGGIAGHKIVPYYIERDPNSQDPNYEESLCAKMTEDGKVFAVVTNHISDSEPCYVKHHTLLLNNENFLARDALGAWNPYVWSPGLGSREGAFRAMVDSLQGQGYFAGKVKLGIVSYDDAETKYEYKVSIKPTLDALHITPEISYVTATGSTDQFARDAQSAELRFSQDKVDHVMFMAGGGAAPLIFMNTAESQLYRPRYGLSSIDSPAFLLQGKAPNAQLHNAVGAGYNEIVDVDSQHGDPYPTGSAEKKCYDILKAAGLQSSSRAAAFGAEYICDGIFLLQAGGLGLQTNLSIQTWASATEHLGSTYQATYSLPNGTDFTPGTRGGGQTYRFLKFVDSCECFQYASGNRQIPRV